MPSWEWELLSKVCLLLQLEAAADSARPHRLAIPAVCNSTAQEELVIFFAIWKFYDVINVTSMQAGRLRM